MSEVWTVFRYDTDDDYKPLLIAIATTDEKAYELLNAYKDLHGDEEDNQYEYTVTNQELDVLFL